MMSPLILILVPACYVDRINRCAIPAVYLQCPIYRRISYKLIEGHCMYSISVQSRISIRKTIGNMGTFLGHAGICDILMIYLLVLIID